MFFLNQKLAGHLFLFQLRKVVKNDGDGCCQERKCRNLKRQDIGLVRFEVCLISLFLVESHVIED